MSYDVEPQLDDSAFWEWFGESKVVDPDGLPRVVYHGTVHEFSEFTKTKDVGFHFGTKEQANDIFSRKRNGRHIIPVYLKLENPVRLTKDPRSWMPDYVANHAIPEDILTPDEIKQICDLGEIELGYARKEAMEVGKGDYLPDPVWCEILSRHHQGSNTLIRDTLKSKGYDGIIYQNKYEAKWQKADSYVVFESRQIKSAIGVQPGPRQAPAASRHRRMKP